MGPLLHVARGVGCSCFGLRLAAPLNCVQILRTSIYTSRGGLAVRSLFDGREHCLTGVDYQEGQCPFSSAQPPDRLWVSRIDVSFGYMGISSTEL